MMPKRSAVVLTLLLSFATPRALAEDTAKPTIREYIREGWKSLTRSHRDLARAAVDPKMPLGDGRFGLYVAGDVDVHAVLAELSRELPQEELLRVDIRRIPADGKAPVEPGIVYLPHPYVVPGGRFNEMYGWDSYFIVLGLLRDGEVERAQAMVDNHLYEVEHYGFVLNANRTYYLTRSQPPLLTEMVLALYKVTHNRDWLLRTLPAIKKYYRYWIAEPHLTAATGLSRYHDLAGGPAPEVLAGEKDAQGHTHYDRVRAALRIRSQKGEDLSPYYDTQKDELTNAFFAADRGMRESGLDPSDRFGPFGVYVLQLNPVCLNSLLFRMETDTQEILETLGRSEEAKEWQARAEARKQTVNRLLWDEKAGLYFDYDFVAQRRRDYPFVTTFLPLWAGIATPRQAARVVKNLPLFERPGGLQTSTRKSGSQWDAPMGWAPLELFAIRGLERYGFLADAERISRKFTSLVRKEFALHGAIFEKYDVVRRRAQVGSHLRFGYTSNEIGFGWTNAAYLELLSDQASAPAQRETKPGSIDARPE
jgi:alpha,alpha-trehalase